jgi:hypothetical protein
MPFVSRRAMAEQERAMRLLRARIATAELDALVKASDAIDAAIARIHREHPNEPAMGIRCLGMRAAQRLVIGDKSEEIA